MFKIDLKNNEAIPIERKNFGDYNLRERQHLQEWIDKSPDILGENLLIIQKEYSGFSDTSERLDLLALDVDGNIVIIENKLDDSGKDVVWQALKYVSYCASLEKDDIVSIYQQYLDVKSSSQNAKDALCAFFDQEDFADIELNAGDQRVILVAANFRKGVTSTALWLMDHDIKIKCIQVTPFVSGDELFLRTEQLLPTPDTEAMRIKRQKEVRVREEMAERHNLRYEFWTYAIPELQKRTGIYMYVSPTKDNWISGASGHSGVAYVSAFTLKSARAEISLSKSKEENKAIFDALHQEKEKLESEFGSSLCWERLDDKISCRIAVRQENLDLTDRDEWPRITAFLGDNIARLKEVFAEPLKKALEQLRQAN